MASAHRRQQAAYSALASGRCYGFSIGWIFSKCAASSRFNFGWKLFSLSKIFNGLYTPFGTAERKGLCAGLISDSADSSTVAVADELISCAEHRESPASRILTGCNSTGAEEQTFALIKDKPLRNIFSLIILKMTLRKPLIHLKYSNAFVFST
ncbi:hypothetical protein [Hymenobacter agri]